jgi:hypothetical protein
LRTLNFRKVERVNYGRKFAGGDKGDRKRGLEKQERIDGLETEAAKERGKERMESKGRQGERGDNGA